MNLKKRCNMITCLIIISLLIVITGCQDPNADSDVSNSNSDNVENSENVDSKEESEEASVTDKLAKYKKINMTPEEAFESLYTKVETLRAGQLKSLFKRYTEDVKIPTTPKGAKDGVYTVESPYDNMGFKHVVTLEIKDEKIVSVKYDEISKEGNGKEEDEEYNKAMKDDAGSCPKEVYPIYREKLMETQDLLGVDAVSGSTYSLYRFNTVASEALYKSQK